MTLMNICLAIICIYIIYGCVLVNRDLKYKIISNGEKYKLRYYFSKFFPLYFDDSIMVHDSYEDALKDLIGRQERDAKKREEKKKKWKPVKSSKKDGTKKVV